MGGIRAERAGGRVGRRPGGLLKVRGLWGGAQRMIGVKANAPEKRGGFFDSSSCII